MIDTKKFAGTKEDLLAEVERLQTLLGIAKNALDQTAGYLTDSYVISEVARALAAIDATGME